MIEWWDKKAGDLQAFSFKDYPTEDHFTRKDAYRVGVHTRQDVILAVSLLSSLNKQMWQAKLLLGAIVFLLAYIAFKH